MSVQRNIHCRRKVKIAAEEKKINFVVNIIEYGI
jgi:hypothetical protein